MASKPVVLPSRTFATQKLAYNYFSSMLNRYGPGDRVDEADAAELAELLQRHPEAPERVGVGIDHFEVQSADYNTQCFRVVRKDGTWARFSFPTCIAPGRRRGE